MEKTRTNCDFINSYWIHFTQLLSLRQTCERYATEAKYKVSRTVPSAMQTSSLATDNKSIPFLETDDINVSMEKGDNKVKRRAEDARDVESDLPKRQKRMETSVNDDEIGETNHKCFRLCLVLLAMCSISGSIHD